MRTINSGAGPLAHQHINGLRERFPEAVITEGYGLTEVTMGATIGPATRSGLRKVGSVGIPVFDTDGYLSIVDRTKDMLLYKGYNVYPREIEELLVARPEVGAAAVVGRPDESVGELPVAFVVPAGEGIDEASLMREVNEQLAPYKRLREVHLTEEIPVSAAGKVLERELRQRL